MRRILWSLSIVLVALLCLTALPRTWVPPILHTTAHADEGGGDE